MELYHGKETINGPSTIDTEANIRLETINKPWFAI